MNIVKAITVKAVTIGTYTVQSVSTAGAYISNKVRHWLHYITSDGKHYRTADGMYYKVKE